MTVAQFVKSAKYVGSRMLRENLSKLIKSKKPVFVTEHGRPVQAMVPFDTLLDILESLEELKDKALMNEIALGNKEYGAGGFVPVSGLKKKLGTA